ncbi:MAG: hypothetical protein ACKVIX_00960, partial [Sphingomonadales bacterium]
MTKTISIIGARGFVAEEFIKLLQNHDGLEIGFVGSRELEGKLAKETLPSLPGKNIRFENIQP